MNINYLESLRDGEDILFPLKKEKPILKKRVECEGCGNPDVYSGCKCKYCKRWYEYAKEEPYDVYEEPDWIGAKFSGGYIPITQEPKRAVAKITAVGYDQRETVFEKILNKWKKTLS